MKSKKGLIALLAPILYLSLTVIMVANLYVFFSQKQYLTVYVDGESMKPTLNNEMVSIDETDPETGHTITKSTKVHYGFVDRSEYVVDQLVRFQIVTTYYPWDSADYAQPYNKDNPTKPIEGSASFKIKRILALPGDTFKIENSVMYLKNDETWNQVEFPFATPTITRNHPETTVGENEYWIAGDNWGHSTDSFDHQVGGAKTTGPIYKENITGVLVCIQGECSSTFDKVTKEDHFYDHVKYSKPIYFINYD